MLFFEFVLEFFLEKGDGFAVGGEAVFFGDRVFEKEELEWHKGEQSVGAENDKYAEAREVAEWIGDALSVNDEFEDDLAEEDDEVETEDVNDDDRLFSEGLVAVKDVWNDDDGEDEGGEFREKVVGVGAVNEAVVEAPEEDGSEGDFDVFPSAFVDGGKKADDFVVPSDVIEKMGEGTDDGDDDSANCDF